MAKVIKGSDMKYILDRNFEEISKVTLILDSPDFVEDFEKAKQNYYNVIEKFNFENYISFEEVIKEFTNEMNILASTPLNGNDKDVRMKRTTSQIFRVTRKFLKNLSVKE